MPNFEEQLRKVVAAARTALEQEEGALTAVLVRLERDRQECSTMGPRIGRHLAARRAVLAEASDLAAECQRQLDQIRTKIARLDDRIARLATEVAGLRDVTAMIALSQKAFERGVNDVVGSIE